MRRAPTSDERGETLRVVGLRRAEAEIDQIHALPERPFDPAQQEFDPGSQRRLKNADGEIFDHPFDRWRFLHDRGHHGGAVADAVRRNRRIRRIHRY